MDSLHLTKVAFGCADFEELRERVALRFAQSGEMKLSTRYKPKRAEEIIGGGAGQSWWTKSDPERPVRE